MTTIPKDYGKPIEGLNFDTKCTDCALSNGCSIPGSITNLNNLKLIVISDYPGHYETKYRYLMWDNELVRGKTYKGSKRIPSWPNAGNYIRRLLEQFGLDTYSDVYFTNAIKCNPEQNKPKELHIKSCSKWLNTELSILESKGYINTPILVAGTTAFKSLKHLGEKSLESLSFKDCRRRVIYVKSHPTVVVANPAAVCSSTFRIENRIVYDPRQLTSVRELPPIPGSPIWNYQKDLELIKCYL